MNETTLSPSAARYLVIDGPLMGHTAEHMTATDTIYRILDGHRVGQYRSLPAGHVRRIVGGAGHAGGVGGGCDVDMGGGGTGADRETA